MKALFSIVCLTMGIALLPLSSHAQQQSPPQFTMVKNKLNGPRLGISYSLQDDALDGTGVKNQRLRENDIGNVISQFGWHFEWAIKPESGGPAFVTEILPFIGGVEFGTVIPSVSAVFGIRLPSGTEFGMGPNVIATFDSKPQLATALVVAVGQTLTFNEVHIPLNVAVLTNRDGNTLSFVFGYALPTLF